jgi:hypothetical protein
MKSFRRRAVGLVVALVASTALVAPSSAGASATTQWNVNATTALITTAAQAPPVSALHLAMVHGAVYDAVNAIDGGYTPYLVKPTATPFDSQDAAAAAAAYHVLISIVPAQQPTLLGQYNTALAGIPDGPAKTGGIAAGVAAANAMILARTGDGRFGAPGFSVPAVPEPGDWRPVPPGFVNDPNGWIRNVKPFMIESASQFRTKGPWSLTSPQYAREFDEVKSLGQKVSTTRTQYQTDASLYWAALDGRGRTPVRPGLPDHRRLGDHRLVGEGVLVVLEADHGDSRGRVGRQPGDGGRPRVGLARPEPAVSRTPVGPSRREREHSRNAAGVLPHRPDDVDGHRRRDREDVHELLRGAQGDRERSRVVGYPLPNRRRAVRPPREAGREVAQAPLLQEGALTS